MRLINSEDSDFVQTAAIAISDGEFTLSETLVQFSLDFSYPRDLDIQASPMDVDFLECQISEDGKLFATHFGYLIVSADESHASLLLPDDATAYSTQRLVDLFLENLNPEERVVNTFDVDGDWAFSEWSIQHKPFIFTDNFMVAAAGYDDSKVLALDWTNRGRPLVGTLRAFLLGKKPSERARVSIEEGEMFDSITIRSYLTDSSRFPGPFTYKVLKPTAPLYPYLKEMGAKLEASYANFLADTEDGFHVTRS